MTSRNEEYLNSFYAILSEKIESLEQRFITPQKKGPSQPVSNSASIVEPDFSAPKSSQRSQRGSHINMAEDMADIRTMMGRSKRQRSESQDEPEPAKRAKVSAVFSKSTDAPGPNVPRIGPLANSNTNSMDGKPVAQEVLQDLLQSTSFFESGMTATLNQKLVKLQNLLHQKDSEISEKDREIQSLKSELHRLEVENSVYREKFDEKTQNSNQGKLALIKALRQLEEATRQEIKIRLHQNSYRLGRVTMVRQGTRFQEFWEDGVELQQTKEQLESSTKEKERLEKLKRQKKGDMDTLHLQVSLICKEQDKLKEKLDKLETEKNVHIQESRRIVEEDNAKYAQQTNEFEAWPVLHGKYLLLSLLGKGGYSEVYKAYDLESQIEIAVKFHQLNPNWAEVVKANYIKHALRENTIHRELNHPRIVKHYDSLEVDSNSFCTILEYCHGEDLHMYLKRCKRIPWLEARWIMQQVFSALKYLSEQPEKIIHYDLKPHNILMNRGEIKITDFGLSKIMDPAKTNMELTSQGVGTYWYLPPECFDSSPLISNKVDVWSAGVIFYEMLYGKKPFGHNMPQEKILKDQVITRATSVEFPTKPNVPAETKEFIRKCLEYDQSQRYDPVEAFNAIYTQGAKK